MINIGKYIEMAINWLTDHFASFFDALSIGIGGFIDGFQHVLFGIPFYITILAFAILAWFKAGKGVAVFTLSGLLLVYGMGFWEETMQTLALVLSSTCLALLLGVPMGIWTANSDRCNKIMRPVLDFMQTMPAFVYLIPAVGLGEVVLKGITQMKIGLGFEGGIAVVILAIILDRITQGIAGKKNKK